MASNSSNNNNNNNNNSQQEQEEQLFKLNPEQFNGIQQIRAAFSRKSYGGSSLPDIPHDLDTDFYLLKWWIGWRGSLPDIIPRLSSYIENRRAAKLDYPDLLTNFRQHDVMKKFMPYFDLSVLDEITINESTNAIVIVFRLEGMNYDNLLNVMNSSDLLDTMFFACEYYSRLVRAQEEKSNRPSGISAIIDFTKVTSLGQFLNPNSTILTIGKLCSRVISEWFVELLHSMVVFNPPFGSLINLVWKMARYVLPENTFQKLTVAKTLDDLLHTHDLQSVPLRQSLVPAISTVSKPNQNIFQTTGIPTPPPNLMEVRRIWPLSNAENPPALADPSKFLHTNLVLKPGAVFRSHGITIRPQKEPGGTRESSSCLFWWFSWTGGDLEYSIIRRRNISLEKTETDDSDPQKEATITGKPTIETLVHPRYAVTGFKLPEQGRMLVNSSTTTVPEEEEEEQQQQQQLGVGGTYVMEFRSTASLFNVKLSYAFEALDGNLNRIEPDK